MERPVNGQANSNTNLFRLDDSNNYAMKTPVKFGKEAGRYIEIVDGAEVNDTFIVSDLSLVKSAELTIENF